MGDLSAFDDVALPDDFCCCVVIPERPQALADVKGLSIYSEILATIVAFTHYYKGLSWLLLTNYCALEVQELEKDWVLAELYVLLREQFPILDRQHSEPVISSLPQLCALRREALAHCTMDSKLAEAASEESLSSALRELLLLRSHGL